MDAVTTSAQPTRRPWSVGKVGDLLVALIAHALVGASWAVTGYAVMGSLGVMRRIAMNSQFAWDTGRLPQPWVIAIGVAAIVVSHLIFRWSMRRLGGGTPAWGPAVVAVVGLFLGVAAGAYFWPGPVQVGEKVGPAMGESTPWDILGWVAYWSRLALPALIGGIAALMFLFSKNSPFVVWWRSAKRLPRTA